MTHGRRRAVAVAVTAALATGGCSVVGGGGPDGIELTAYFPRAVALYEQSDVRVLGLSAGEVQEVEALADRVRVRMRIDDDIVLPRDVRATLVPQSLIGERYVQLSPAWTAGRPRLEDGAVIGLDRTSVPVEPDEALEAVRDFLDALDPDATGRLVGNLADGLRDAGPSLNDALRGLGDLATTVADKDEELGRIIDQFDRFTATVRTREQQLGRVMDDFAKVTSVLADERRAIEGIVRGLASVSRDAAGLVREHGGALERDIDVLARTLRAAITNIDSVRALLDAGPIIIQGFTDGIDPTHHRVDLRTQFTPVVQEALNKVLVPLGFPEAPGVCIPVEVSCAPTTAAPGAAVGDTARARSAAERVGGGVLAVGRFARRSARALLGVGP